MSLPATCSVARDSAPLDSPLLGYRHFWPLIVTSMPSPPITHRYAALVRAARDDASGAVTQARSVNGHLVYSRAGFAAPQVTAVLRRAVAEHGRRGWWEVG